jgi:hypothetical protein
MIRKDSNSKDDRNVVNTSNRRDFNSSVGVAATAPLQGSTSTGERTTVQYSNSRVAKAGGNGE